MIVVDVERLPDALVARYRAVRLDAVARLLGNAGIADPAIRPLGPGPVRMAGSAVTVASRSPDTALAILALGAASAGDVLLIAPGGDAAAAWGGGLTRSADIAGLAGVAIDGLVVDSDAIRRCRTPVFCRGATLRQAPRPAGGDINVPMRWGGVAVSPGDLVLGDGDGVCVVPRDRAAALIEAAEAETARIDRALAEMTARGETLFDRRGGRSFAAELGLTWPGEG